MLSPHDGTGKNSSSLWSLFEITGLRSGARAVCCASAPPNLPARLLPCRQNPHRARATLLIRSMRKMPVILAQLGLDVVFHRNRADGTCAPLRCHRRGAVFAIGGWLCAPAPDRRSQAAARRAARRENEEPANFLRSASGTAEAKLPATPTAALIKPGSPVRCKSRKHNRALDRNPTRLQDRDVAIDRARPHLELVSDRHRSHGSAGRRIWIISNNRSVRAIGGTLIADRRCQ